MTLEAPAGYTPIDNNQINPIELAGLVFAAAPDWGEQSAELWRQKLVRPNLIALGLVDASSGLAAAATMEVSADNKCVQLSELAVAEAHRRLGLGTYLVEARVGLADDLGIEQTRAIFKETNMMLDVYRQLGFQITSGTYGVRYRPDLQQVQGVDVVRPAVWQAADYFEKFAAAYGLNR